MMVNRKCFLIFGFLILIIGTFYWNGGVSLAGTDLLITILGGAPTGLVANPISSSRIDLSWSSVAAAVSYKVYRDGVAVGSPTVTFFSDNDLRPATTYSYTVSAVNLLGMESDQSSPVSATTPESEGGTGSFPPVSYICKGNVLESLGGEVWCTFNSGQIVKLVFPSRSIKGTAVIVIGPQEKTEIIKTYPLPKNTQIIGDLVAVFEALSGGKELEKFESEIPITFTYSDSQIKDSGMYENTFKIYFWNNKTFSWQVLPSNEVNTFLNNVTAYTSQLTLFAVIGETEKKPTLERILGKIQDEINKIFKKIADLRARISQFFRKEAVAEAPEEAPPEEEIKKEPINIFQRSWLWFKQSIMWLGQSIVNFWQKIWPF